MPVLPAGSVKAFEKDIKNRHLVYDYAVPGSQTASGKDEQWRYEMWFHSEDRIVYMMYGREKIQCLKSIYPLTPSQPRRPHGPPLQLPSRHLPMHPPR